MGIGCAPRNFHDKRLVLNGIPWSLFLRNQAGPSLEGFTRHSLAIGQDDRRRISDHATDPSKNQRVL
jgi:hypothetical protein